VYWLTFVEYNQCLASLCVTDPRDDKERIEAAKGGLLPAAYHWVLDHPDFRRWRDDPDCHLLWIKGDPGKGKTMLLCGIIDKLQNSPANGHLISYFFCQATDERLHNATAVLRSLIYMLAKQNLSLAKHIQSEYKNTGAKLFEGPNVWYTLSRVFSNILQEPDLQRMIFVIDALDECQYDLRRLLELINKHSATNRIKWIVSSRNRTDIEETLHISDSRTRLSLELKTNAKQIGDAVNAYIDYRVTELAKKWNDESLRNHAQQMLRTKAQGTFLWAALVVQELREVDSWDVKDVLNEVPAGLDELYGRMMQQIAQLPRKTPDYCRQLLATVSATYRPLYLAELGLLSGLSSSISTDPENIKKIAKKCGSFLTIREETVSFVHQSAKDYLDKNASGHLFSSGITEMHRDIYSRSINEMTKILRRDIYGARHPGKFIEEIVRPNPDPLSIIRYSCIYWIDHLNDAGIKKNIQTNSLIQQFLERKYLYWLEALALLRALSQGISSIFKLFQLFQVCILIIIIMIF
jgi:hypothetical protein